VDSTVEAATLAVCEASSAVSVMGVPLGAETAASSPTALSGRGRADTREKRLAAAIKEVM